MTFDVDPDYKVKVTQTVSQFPLHHVIYAPAKFAVATFNGLGGDAFTRNLTEGRTDRRTTDRLEIYKPFFLKKRAGIINRYDLNSINTSVILLINIHLNISVYGQDASTGRTFLHSKTPNTFYCKHSSYFIC